MYSHLKQQEIRSSLEFKHFILDEYNAHQDMHRARAVAARYFSIKVSLDFVKRILRAHKLPYKKKELDRYRLLRQL